MMPRKFYKNYVEEKMSLVSNSDLGNLLLLFSFISCIHIALILPMNLGTI